MYNIKSEIEVQILGEVFVYQLDRVTKFTAKKLYNQNVTLYIMPGLTVPTIGGYIDPFRINKHYYSGYFNSDFDAMLHSYKNYSCQDRETGLYPSFYRVVGMEVK